MSDVDVKSEVAPPVLDDGDHEKFSHVVVPASAVAEAYVNGTPVEALCGKRWVPTRAPERYPLCPTCKDLLARVGRNPDGSKI